MAETTQRDGDDHWDVPFLVSHGANRRAVIFQSVRRGFFGIGAVACLLALYLAAPLPTRVQSAWGYILLAALFLVLYLALLAWSVNHLRHARYPVADGLMIVIVLGTVIILGYAYTYIVADAQTTGAFSESLTKASSVYFTVTVLTTVGFGDITPVTDLARFVVTTQMLVGLTAISLGAKLIVQSTKLARSQSNQPSEPAPDNSP